MFPTSPPAVAHRRVRPTILAQILLVVGLGPSWSYAQASSGAERRPVEEEPPAKPTTVVVVGKRPSAHSPPDTDVAGSVLGEARLRAPGMNAATVLREVPGVQVTEVGGLGAPATATLRGANSAQTPVYLAGIRINDEVGGTANLADLPLHLMQRVEVYRSNAPWRADRWGIGGAILFEPREPRTESLQWNGTVGSFGARETWLSAERNTQHSALLVSAKLSTARNDYAFFDDRGTLFREDDGGPARLANADSQQRTVWLSARQSLGPARLHFLYHHAGREQGAPKLALLPTKLARIRFARDLLALQSSIPLERFNGELTLTTSSVLGETTVRDPLLELGQLAKTTQQPGSRVQQAVGLTEELSPELNISQQVTASVESLQRKEQGTLAMAAQRIRLRAAFGVSWQAAKAVSTRALVAFSCFDTGERDLQPCREAAPTGRIGVSYQGAWGRVYANGSHAIRLPTLSELHGVSLLVRGNPFLKTEKGQTLELGWRHQWSRARRRLFWADLSAFRRSTSDIVAYVRTAQGYLHPKNLDTARVLGAELAAGAEPLSWLELSTGASVLDPRETSPSRQTANDILPFRSRLLTYALVSVNGTLDKSWLRSASLTVRWNYQSNRFADAAGLAVIPEQQWLDVNGTAHALQDRLTVRARLANVFAGRRFDVVGFPLPGRSAFFSMESTW